MSSQAEHCSTGVSRCPAGQLAALNVRLTSIDRTFRSIDGSFASAERTVHVVRRDRCGRSTGPCPPLNTRFPSFDATDGVDRRDLPLHRTRGSRRSTRLFPSNDRISAWARQNGPVKRRDRRRPVEGCVRPLDRSARLRDGIGAVREPDRCLRGTERWRRRRGGCRRATRTGACRRGQTGVSVPHSDLARQDQCGTDTPVCPRPQAPISRPQRVCTLF
jgi:hypothetical protein